MVSCAVCGGEGPEDFSQPIDHNQLCRIGRRRRYLEDLNNPVGVPGLFANQEPRPPAPTKKRPMKLDLVT